MSDTVISVEHLSKRYRLGVINSGTFKNDLKIWFAQARGKPNPLSKVGEADYGNRDGDILWALRDINFTVQRGEALGIIGRNGAGKSTLLKILSRVTTPTEGHIHVKGRIASLLEVGTGFHPELTGRENIYLNGAIMGMNRAEVNRKLDEIIDFSGVEKFIDTPVKRYSSGMYVRLAFAVAAHLEPEILIVDEVLAVGDAEFQKKCLGKMGEVAHEGRTVLFVSHNTSAIMKLCNTGIVLENGEIVFNGKAGTAVLTYLQSKKKMSTPIILLPPSDFFEPPGRGIELVLSNSDGVQKNEFLLKEKINFELTFNIFRPTKSVIAAVGLSTIHNVPIITYWSRPNDLEVGLFKVIFPCELNLSSSEIQISVGLSSEERPFYQSDDVGRIVILDVAIDQQPLRASGTGIILGEQGFAITKLDI